MDIYCASCPVVEACGEDGTGRQGVWGGKFLDANHVVLGPDDEPLPQGGARLVGPGGWGRVGVTHLDRRCRARVRYRDPYDVRRDVDAYGATEQEARDKLADKLRQLATENEEIPMARNLSPQGDSSQGKVDSDHDGDTDANPTDGDPPVKDNAHNTTADKHGHVHIAPAPMK